MKHSITVYGTEFVDTICELLEYPKENESNEVINTYRKFGGTENFVRSLVDGFIVRRFVTGCEATIILNTKTGSRTSMADWKDSWLMNESIEPTDWLHVMYLDKLSAVGVKEMMGFRRKAKVISADLCLSKQTEMGRLVKVLPFIDYLIISDVEAKGIRNALHLPKNIIIHSPKLVCVNGDFIQNIYYENRAVNTLGAGDMFAATFVSCVMLGMDIKRASHVAGVKSSKFVMGEENEKD